MEKIARRDSFNLKALEDAAYAFGQNFKIGHACKYIRRMEKLVGNDAGGLALIAQAWGHAYRSDEALNFLHKSVSAKSTPAESHLAMATLFEKDGQLDEAADALRNYLSARPNDMAGLRLEALIHRRNGDSEKAFDIYLNLENRLQNSEPMLAAQVYNEWANLLDRDGDYEAAFGYLLKSKELLKKQPDYSKQYKLGEFLDQRYDYFLNSLDAGTVHQWLSAEGEEDGGNVYLTGCPRSGTTLIEKILDAHPEIVSADELAVFPRVIVSRILEKCAGKMDYFDAAAVDQLPRNFLKRQSRDYFRSLEAAMNEPINGRVLIDKNPSNTAQVPILAKVLPSSRILYAMRDPRDVVISSLFCWLDLNTVSSHFLTTEDTVKRVVKEHDSWQRIKRLLPEGRWCETRYENTIQNPMAESCRILDWLNLTWNDSVKDYRSMAERRGVSSPTYAEVTQPVYQGAVGRWKNYSKVLEGYEEAFEPILEVLDYQ